uniref:Uncharacterized protein n=1 Tax=Salix viminalis TaxID=40686 RepID=A0A6N2NHN1_SALVM
MDIKVLESVVVSRLQTWICYLKRILEDHSFTLSRFYVVWRVFNMKTCFICTLNLFSLNKVLASILAGKRL